MMKRALSLFLFVLLLFSVANAESGAWVCPSCGQTGNTGNFCPICATERPSSLYCPNCGTAAGDIDVYCTMCGTPLPGRSGNQPRKQVTVGRYVTFGHYPQNSGGSKTSIEWLVLEVQGRSALLISRFGLDCQLYAPTRSRHVTWAASDVRHWLNSTFLQTAFSDLEQQCLQYSQISCASAQSGSGWSKGSGGEDTFDYVFLLSRSEVEYYFPTESSRLCAPTAYARSHGASSGGSMTDSGRAGFWWLRMQGNIDYSAAIVNNDGKLHRANYYDAQDNCVRPAIWVDISSAVFQAEQQTSE